MDDGSVIPIIPRAVDPCLRGYVDHWHYDLSSSDLPSRLARWSRDMESSPRRVRSR